MRGGDEPAAAATVLDADRASGIPASLPAKLDPETPLILDFDETYWLRNSTEVFLAGVRPAWLAAFVLRLIEVLRPWRFLPGPDKDHVWRDWTRVNAVILLFPWSLALWRRRAVALGPRWLNPMLAELVERVPADRRWLVSNGFRPIVAPLVDALPGSARLELLASPLLCGFAWRRRGKRAIVEAALGPATLEKAVVVTDNDEDAELLAAAGHAVHHKWPDASYEPAHADAYLPFYYMERIKRPGASHLLNVVLKDELILLLLIYLWATPSLAVLLAILVLHASFWVIYEILYVENDRVAAALEAEPTLSSAYHDTPHRFSEPGAWLFGLGLGALGVLILQLAPAAITTPGLLVSLALWAGLLGALRALAYLYNHVDKTTRVPLYLPLQAFKLLGLALLLPLPLAAMPLVAAHLASLWLPYVAYRLPGRTREAWRAPIQLYRLVLALVFSLALGLAAWSPAAAATGLDGSSAALLAVGLAWFALKARADLQALVRNAGWLRPKD